MGTQLYNANMKTYDYGKYPAIDTPTHQDQEEQKDEPEQ